MNVLRRYIVVAILRSVAKVLAVLVLVGGFIQLVGQLDDVGIADYGLGQAITYVALSMPRTIFQSLPAAALLGSLLSLGDLAVHRELVVMRAVGVSKRGLITTVGLAGFALAVFMALLGESLAPSLGAYAREMRAEALLEDSALADAQSTWLKDGNRILSLRRSVDDFSFDSGMYLFALDDEQHLRHLARADSAEVGEGDRWRLSNYSETAFTVGGISATHEAQTTRQYNLSSELLDLAVVRHDLLDTPGLSRYIEYLRSNDLDADRYLIAYWGRMASVVSVVFMCLLALPFVSGALRSAGTGARLVVGLVIGLGFYVLDEMLANSSEVFGIDPVVVAWAPTAALACVTTAVLLRLK